MKCLSFLLIFISVSAFADCPQLTWVNGRVHNLGTVFIRNGKFEANTHLREKLKLNVCVTERCITDTFYFINQTGYDAGINKISVRDPQNYPFTAYIGNGEPGYVVRRILPEMFTESVSINRERFEVMTTLCPWNGCESNLVAVNLNTMTSVLNLPDGRKVYQGPAWNKFIYNYSTDSSYLPTAFGKLREGTSVMAGLWRYPDEAGILCLDTIRTVQMEVSFFMEKDPRVIAGLNIWSKRKGQWQKPYVANESGSLHIFLEPDSDSLKLFNDNSLVALDVSYLKNNTSTYSRLMIDQLPKLKGRYLLSGERLSELVFVDTSYFVVYKPWANLPLKSRELSLRFPWLNIKHPAFISCLQLSYYQKEAFSEVIDHLLQDTSVNYLSKKVSNGVFGPVSYCQNRVNLPPIPEGREMDSVIYSHGFVPDRDRHCIYFQSRVIDENFFDHYRQLQSFPFFKPYPPQLAAPEWRIHGLYPD